VVSSTAHYALALILQRVLACGLGTVNAYCRSTNVIGIYSGIGYLNAVSPFLSELIGGLQEGCDQHHKDLLVHGTFRGLSVDDVYAELLDGRLDGLVVQALPSDPLVVRLAASHLPVVALADAISSVPSVVVDDYAGGACSGRARCREGSSPTALSRFRQVDRIRRAAAFRLL